MPEPFYRAEDGSSHPTPELAERRDAINNAREELKDAERRLLVALANTAITADNVVLTEVRGMDLWTIGRRRDRVGYGVYAPCLHKIESPMYWGSRHGLRVDDGQVSIVYENRHEKRNETTVHTVRVNEVYTSERKARAALGDELAQWLVWQVQDFGRELTGPDGALVRGIVRAVGDTSKPNPVKVATEALQTEPRDDDMVKTRDALERTLLDVLHDLGAIELVEEAERVAERWRNLDA